MGQMWESQCPYIRCEQIDSMLEDGVCIPRPYAHTVRALAASIAVECFARCVSPSRQDQRLRHGGCGGFKRDRVASHAKTFQPKEQGTRDLGVLFEEGLRKERERMIALIKEAYWLAYEGMQMQKFYSLNPAVVASELHRATRPAAAPRYSVSSIVIGSAKPTDAEFVVGLHAWSRVQGRARLASGAALSVQVARGRGTRACSAPCATARCVRGGLFGT